MKLNNSIKLAIINFALFWKTLVYKIIAFGVVLLLILPIWNQLGVVFTNSGFWESLATLFNGVVFQGIPALLGAIFNTFSAFFEAIASLASLNLIALIYLIIVVCVVMPFLLYLSDIPASESVYTYMSSLHKNSFTVNFLDNLGKSCRYSFLKTFIELPFWALLIYGVYGISGLCSLNVAMQIASPFMLFIFIVLMFDLKITLQNGWVPSMVAFNSGAIASLKKGLKAVSRNYWSIFSSFAVVMTCAVALLYLFSGYSLVVVIPLMSLITAVFGQVLFFESQGMNYYIAPENIIKPRKLEQSDSLRKVRYKI